MAWSASLRSRLKPGATRKCMRTDEATTMFCDRENVKPIGTVVLQAGVVHSTLRRTGA